MSAGRPRVVGLTGGIAAGKSTVARMLAERGAAVVDADRVARDVVAPGTPALARLVDVFGEAILRPDGTLDRSRLGERVFADPAARQQLEAITHPAIMAASAARIGELLGGGAPLVIYEAALLVETGGHRGMDRLVVVVADDDVRLARLMARDGIDEPAARRRLAAQLPQEEKAAVADHVIDNSGPLAETRRQVDALLEALGASEAP